MLLKDLCEINGVSGNEKAVRDYILANIRNDVTACRVDRIGNLIVEKKLDCDDRPKVLLCAHMDEVGLLITEITAEGYLKFKPVGGIDPAVLMSKTLIVNNAVHGVIGLKAVHLQKPEERKKIPDSDDLYIDIGAANKEEAEKLVKLGDYASFLTVFEEIGDIGLYKGKALDDRVGCAILMELLKQDFPCHIIAAFTVQEEVGLRGSKVLSNTIEADLAINIEATGAADYSEADREDWVVELGRGPACSLIDSATIYRPDAIKKVMETARTNHIPLQFRQGTRAANDAGNIHQAGTGIPTITLSVPCRNIHTMSSLISRQDYAHCLELVKCMLNNLNHFI
ncbi:M42 family peptidase [Dehalobacter sp. DCM]|uniref:M42 family metallopeptidase n=1 Tax=Dehalobacter sp. DCM TaxID=2907827 RepID=UPI0030812BCC|nr:M42 family peptidase [Dehalobacter sp. DCM]